MSKVSQVLRCCLNVVYKHIDLMISALLDSLCEAILLFVDDEVTKFFPHPLISV